MQCLAVSMEQHCVMSHPIIADTQTSSLLIGSFCRDIEETKTVDEMFKILSTKKYWSALKSGLLERIIKDHCSKSVEVQKLKNDFLKEQQAFRQKTTLLQFAKISNDATVGSEYSEIIFEMKDGWDGTLEDAEKIRCTLMISDDFAAEYSMSFKRLRNSLVWAFPRSCQVNTTVLRIPPAFYRDNHVRRVLVKGVCIIDMKVLAIKMHQYIFFTCHLCTIAYTCRLKKGLIIIACIVAC